MQDNYTCSTLIALISSMENMPGWTMTAVSTRALDAIAMAADPRKVSDTIRQSEGRIHLQHNTFRIFMSNRL